MSRAQPTNFEPHLRPCDEHGETTEARKAILWAVVMKTGPGQYDWLSEALPKRMAARRMRQIRQEMAELWWKNRQTPAHMK